MSTFNNAHRNPFLGNSSRAYSDETQNDVIPVRNCFLQKRQLTPDRIGEDRLENEALVPRIEFSPHAFGKLGRLIGSNAPLLRDHVRVHEG